MAAPSHYMIHQVWQELSPLQLKIQRETNREKKTVYNRNVKNLTKKLFHCDKRIIAQVLTNGRNESRFNNLPNGDRREFKYTDA